KSQESSEVKQFSGVLVGTAIVVQQNCPAEGQQSNDKDVVGWRTAPRLEMAKNLPWQHSIAAHSEQQACGAESSGEPTAECCDDKNQSHGIEQQRTAHAATYVHESCFQVGEQSPVGPHSSAQVDLEGAAHTSQNACDHHCQQNVAFRILHVLRQRGHTVKADIGECGEGSRSPNAVRIEGGRIIERLQRKQPA